MRSGIRNLPDEGEGSKKPILSFVPGCELYAWIADYAMPERAAARNRSGPTAWTAAAAKFLDQDGVPLYHLQALLGHNDHATTQRYAHRAPDAHNKVIESWSRRATHVASSSRS